MGETPVIAGAGGTPVRRADDGTPVLELVAEALGEATADANVSPEDLDGFVTNMGAPLSVDYHPLCTALGLDVRFAHQTWSHGRFVGPALQLAAMAVAHGLAECVAVGAGVSFGNVSHLGGGESVTLQDAEHAERPWYGMTAPVAGNALSARYYMERYGATSRDLAHIARTFRHHASLNPRAQFTDPLELSEHQSSRKIVDPLRLLDCSPRSSGAAFLIVRREDALDSGSESGVSIIAMEGLHAGREEYLFARPGMGVRTQAASGYDADTHVGHVYDRAGIDRSDVDGLYTYDAFTPNVWYTLERWGFCEPGTAFEFTRDGNVGLDGQLPMNTNGGLLSEGHVSGWNHFVEMYRQLRGEAGERQLPDVEILQWATPFGDTLVLQGDGR